MPRFLQPKNSTQHRVAAIALYRALLSRCSSAPLADDDRVSLRNAIRNKFRRNRNLQSPYLLGLSYKAGYETLDHLDASSNGNSASLDILKQLVPQLSKSITRTPRPRVYPAPISPPKERLSCLPPERAVLNVRPFAKTSGPRRVPIIATANGVPFLRLTKPQPPALSRMLRQRLTSKMNLFNVKVTLGNWWLPMAQQEDEWDALVNTRAGRKLDAEEEKVQWVDAIKMSERENQAAYEKDLAKDRAYIRKMQRIVDLETKLALEEGQTIIRGRKKRPIKVIKPPKPRSQ
ncbi:hypothetical protein HBH56_033060 [Parastagonospora nodorum]|uniref:Complex 1 LYR protein domain-containing protein n=2 Tax=Phaeosphaeria nodorum (strain SN15 / ATCC MYA-4574 / FGSC 10173) TaxID=321614 RepID=A0A7U2F836_PHANO|nr:hypothetical protein SNOG_07145 [Parastagonospora nodorum SN15]KAH3918195.1 hypothetical protein HBH56_033060 [Parastagonospora nodorum]EAT85796.1 hypothetical protein SNOG_07145 [Parastagonospora nodorum SN15]KAH3934050.1 hypothetical protein HBH54_066370 [Parastagonospora nodorum]KAH3952806.1 hypothetical protein HBH53_043660 [Parastagonospora nodorum]KAH3979732.1 hypothetical protein HBH51_054690 [Parastagonospora nodorum]